MDIHGTPIYVNVVKKLIFFFIKKKLSTIYNGRSTVLKCIYETGCLFLLNYE